ncbi:hypothetical protein H2203_002051 [Taxawa tesnikishii (nom. ined.)]|nr:hypothetical protein H2203_002051 [Dothideales sp. JES 119]
MAGLPNGHASPAPPASQLIQEKLQQRLEAFKNDYENEITSRRHWQTQANAVQVQANNAERALQQASDVNPFVLALIDGDGAVPFSPAASTASSAPADSAKPGAAAGNSWAFVGKSGTVAKNIKIATVKSPATRKFIVLNSYNDRIDARLPRPDYAAQQRLLTESKPEKCVQSQCWFQGLHDIDTNPMWKLYENGDKEAVKSTA